MSEGNAFLASQIWSIISPLPFAYRFALYDNWKGTGLAKDALTAVSSSSSTTTKMSTTSTALPLATVMQPKPMDVIFAEVKALHVCKGYVKRLSKENIRVMGRQLARLTHGCPLVVLNHILNQIEAFDNLIPVVIEALRYSTDMSRDCLACLLLLQLQKDDNKLKKGV